MKANDLQKPSKQGAGCLIYARSSGNILLIQRSEYVPVPLTWTLPGGTVDPLESPKRAAIREVFEEVGYNLSGLPFTLIYKNEVHAPRFCFYTFACVIPKEFTPTLNYESVAYKWCSLDNLPSPLHWGMEQLISHDAAAKRLKTFIDMCRDKQE